MTSLWVIESSKNGRYWNYYSTAEDIDSAEEMLERLKQIVSHERVFRGVQYIRDESTGVDRPFLLTDQLFMHNHSYNEPHTRDWYQEHDPQSLVDSDNEHNRP